MRNKFMSLALFCSASFSAFAQQTRVISLQEAIQKVATENEKIQASLQKSTANKWAARTLDFGKTNVQVMYGQYNSAALDNNITVNQAIPNPATIVRHNQWKNEVATSEDALHAMNVNDVELEVKKVYLRNLYLKAQYKLQKESDSLYQILFTTSSRRLELGDGNIWDKVNAEASWRSAQLKTKQTLFDLQSAHNTLQLMLNTTDSLVLIDDIYTLTSNGAVYADSATIANNPQNQYLKAQENLTRKEFKLSKSKLGPDFNVGVFSQTLMGWQKPYQDGSEVYNGSSSRFNGVMVGVAIPLWFRPYTNRNKSLSYSLKAMEQYRTYEQKRYQTEYKNLMNEYSKWTNALNYSKTFGLPQAAKLYQHTQTAYQAGLINFTDVNQSIQTALNFKQDYLLNIYQLKLTTYNIEWIMGESLKN